MLSIGKYCIQKNFWTHISKWSTRQLSAVASTQTLDKLVLKVDADVRRNGRAFKRDILNIYENVTKNGISQPTYSLTLLRCLGSLLPEMLPEARNQVVSDLWKYLTANNLKLDVSHYNALLNVYLENENDFDPRDILAEMESKNIIPNRVTYQRLLHRYCQMGDIEGALHILELMKSKSIPISQSIFNSLIVGYAKAGDIDAAVNAISEMESAGIEATNISYKTLLCSLCELLQSKPEVEAKIDEVLSKIETNDIQMTNRDWLDVTKSIASVNEHSPRIDQMLAKCKQEFGFNQDCFTIILELVNERKLETALKVLYNMKSTDSIAERSSSGTFLVCHLVRTGVDPETVVKICDQLTSKGINKNCFSKVAEVSFEECDLETCKFYVKTFIERSGNIAKLHYFWPLLAKCKNEAEILKILEEDVAPIISKSSFNSACDTFTDYIWPKIESDIDIVIERCKELNISFIVLLSSLIKFKLINNQLAEVNNLLEQEKYFSNNLFGHYIAFELATAFHQTSDLKNTIGILKKFADQPRNNSDHNGLFLTHLVSIRGVNDFSDVRSLVQEMKNSGVFITPRYEEVISQRLELDEDDKELLSSITLEAPEGDEVEESRDRIILSVEELEQQYADLKAKGIVARGTMRQLLMAYCRKRFDTTTEEGKTELNHTRNRIEELLKDMNEIGGNFTNSMRASLVQFYASQCEDLETALSYKPEDSAIDLTKVLMLAQLLVKKGKVKECINFLQEESTKDRSDFALPSYKRIESETYKTLNNAVEAKVDRDNVKALLDAILNLTGVKPTTIMLGPLIKLHIINNDFDKAFEEYKFCVENFGVSPWKGELMKQAILNDDSARLQQITDLSITSHGEHNTLFDLGLAFLLAEKPKQAKKVLSTPGLRVSDRRIRAFADKCLSKNELHLLEQFIPLAKNMFDMNMDELYYHLLKGYANNGNVEKGYEVWTKMQEDNVIASEKTLQLISEFLGEHQKDAVKN